MLYETASASTTYDFSFVPFEVREDTSWATTMENKGETLFWSLGTLFAILSFLSLVGALACVGMFLYQIYHSRMQNYHPGAKGGHQPLEDEQDSMGN